MSQDNATPSPLDALLQQADACYSQDDHVGAIAPLDEALQLTNRHPMIMRALGTQLFLAGRYTWSRMLFEELTNAQPENVEDHIHHAIASYHDGDADTCAAALQQALALDPAHADALRLTADLDVAEGRYEAASQKYEQIAERHGISVQSLHGLAYCQFKIGDLARSENTYEQLLEFNAEDDLAKDNLKAVRTAFAQQENNMATEENEPSEISAIPASAAESALEQADFFLQAGNSTAALEELKQAVLADPQDAALVEGYGALLFNLQDFEEARNQFRHLIELAPSDANAYTRLAMTCYELDRLEEFESALGLAMEIEPENPELLHFLGKVNLEADRFLDAGRLFSKLVELEPDNPKNLLALGKCLTIGGEQNAAVETFQRVLMLDPENEMAISNLEALGITEWVKPSEPAEPIAKEEDSTEEPIPTVQDILKSIEHCLQTDDLPGAVEQLTQGLVHHPDDLELLNALGNFHFQTGRAEAALAAFQRKVELQPENPENHLQVAGAAFVVENFELFETHLEFVLKAQPDNPQALKLLASANFKSENYAEAAKLYVQLAELLPEDIEVILALGVSFHHEQDSETARSCFKRALELDPYNDIAAENLKALPSETPTEETTETIEPESQSEVVARPDHEIPRAASVGNLAHAQMLLGQGRRLEAWTATVEAIELRAFHPEAYLHLAEIALDAEDEQQALACLERLVNLTPQWEVAQKALQSLQQKPDLTTSSLDWPALPKLAEEPRLSVSMIVKNEEQFLDQCLSALDGVAHQIVVVDTGSTDRTVQIAKAHGAEVHHFDWCDDFAAARNFALEHARGDWVLVLDADEVLTAEGLNGLRQDMATPNLMGCRIRCVHLEPSPNGGYQPMADAWHYIPRLVRNAPGLHFVGIIHEQIFSSTEVRAKDWQMKTGFGKTALDHYGYAQEIKTSRNKIERNITLLERALEDSPQEPTLLMSYALDLYNRGDVEKALETNRQAFQIVSEYPPDGISPEVRERLLSVFSNLLLQSEMHEELIEVAESPLAKDCGPTSSILFMYALALFKSGRVEDAVDPLRECIAKLDEQTYCAPFPGSTGAAPHHLLADCLAKQNQPGEALEQYRAALDLKPDHAGVRHDFARLLTQEDRPEAAIELLHEAIQLGTMNVTLWSLGSQIVNGHLTDTDIALRWTDCAIQEDLTHPEIRKQRGIALLSAGQFTEALPYFTDATQPHHPLNEAGQIMCNVLTGKPETLSDPANEETVSTAFVNWYRRLLERGQEQAAREVQNRLDKLANTLPTAVSILREAFAEAD